MIETEYIVKMLSGYAQIDRGTPVFYSTMVEKLIGRGLENLDPVTLSEIAKTLSKATEVTKGGYGFYTQMEKTIKSSLHSGRVNFVELSKIVENLLPANIGSNDFHK